MGWIGASKGLRRFAPAAARVSRDAVSEAVARLRRGARIVDLGAGGRRITPETVTVDGDPKSRPDVLADLGNVPLHSASADAVFCTGTLEHVGDVRAATDEILRILKPGGLAYIDVPFMQPFHADPGDYRRWTLHGLRAFCRDLGLEEVDAGVCLGPGSAVCWVVSEYVRVVLGYGKVGFVAAMLTRAALQPLLWIDGWVTRRASAERLASGVFVLGRKPARATGI